jgi:hypothetical protein
MNLEVHVIPVSDVGRGIDASEMWHGAPQSTGETNEHKSARMEY